MKNTLIIFIGILLCSMASHAQKYQPIPFDISVINNDQSIDKPSAMTVMEIDTGDIFPYFAASGKELLWMTIFTEGCGGTPYAMKYINEVEEKYDDKVLILPISSDKYKWIGDMRKEVADNNMRRQVFIISEEKYGKYGDDRKKGKLYRDLICEECREDVIGVPYHLVFDKEGNVLYHGYVSRNEKKGIPADFITYLLEKN